MFTDQPISPGLLRMGGIAGILVILFLPGVALQMNTGWFPETHLQDGAMTEWLTTVAAQRSLALLGVGFSILAILCFLPCSLILYRLLPQNHWLSTAGLASYILGSSLALTAFTFGFAFTLALTDLAATGQAELSGLATLGMRGFLAADDLATTLIGTGHLFMATLALHTGLLPRWLCWWGIASGLLVILVLLRFVLPVLAAAMIGYPLVILWFVLTGVVMLRKAARESGRAAVQPAM